MFSSTIVIAAAAPAEGVLSLVRHAGLDAKLVMLALLVFSVASWAVIFWKYKEIRAAKRQGAEFVKVFWEARSLSSIYDQAPRFGSALEAEVFRAGYRELKALGSLGGASAKQSLVEAVRVVGLTTVERALDASISLQVRKLERGLGLLATTASATPFIGLFGTVLGIIRAFQGISAGAASTVQAVAPGIAEALIATAAGLAAAIPAVLFYNLFHNQIGYLAGELEGFRTEFLNLAQRQVLRDALASE
ncbi:MAG: MotA/TolQ/ExbB proton channel family protein [Deltaproteobacteria bacterium]|nr:MotA/TolQ/ExbB proton channel family protein [Deltaproteobacteria bacterium]